MPYRKDLRSELSSSCMDKGKPSKIPKKYGYLIIFAVTAIAVISLLSIHLPTESKEQDQILDRFFFSIAVSLFGALFIWLKKALRDKYLTDTFQTLIFIMIPFASLIPVFSEPKIFWYIIPLYFASIFLWFIITDDFIVGGKKYLGRRERDDEQKIALKVNVRLLLLLIGLSSFMFYLYFLLIVPQVNNLIN